MKILTIKSKLGFRGVFFREVLPLRPRKEIGKADVLYILSRIYLNFTLENSMSITYATAMKYMIND